MLHPDAITALVSVSHGDPFSVLGVHADDSGRRWLRAFLPGALHVEAWTPDGRSLLCKLTACHDEGLFEGVYLASASADYRLHVHWEDGSRSHIDDPYRFPPVLGDMDLWLMGEGTHLRPYEVLGATQREMLGVAGTSFAVWAPNASCVSVVGDFNFWDGRRHPMRLRRECGVWEIFLPGVSAGTR
ncbi:MAG TPA: 1,4-alpha-glucan branching enzyme, partial [Rhizobacter sp.]|nr:1,4-alpha-glucan branching enzyme [Rhizobacter sp.]